MTRAFATLRLETLSFGPLKWLPSSSAGIRFFAVAAERRINDVYNGTAGDIADFGKETEIQAWPLSVPAREGNVWIDASRVSTRDDAHGWFNHVRDRRHYHARRYSSTMSELVGTTGLFCGLPEARASSAIFPSIAS